MAQKQHISMKEARAHWLIRCGQRLGLEHRRDESYELAYDREKWNAHIGKMRNEFAKEILWWKGTNDDQPIKEATGGAPPGGGGNGNNKDGPADEGPGKDGKQDGKPSGVGMLFSRMDVPGHKNTQNAGQSKDVQEEIGPELGFVDFSSGGVGYQEMWNALPVAVWRQIKKVEDLPQINKSKIAERCVRTTLKMFRKAELEKAMKGDAKIIERCRKKGR